MKAKFLRICPYGKTYLDRLVAECIQEIALISALTVAVLLLWNGLYPNTSRVYYAESMLMAVYLVAMEVPNYKIQQRENRIYREMLLYLSRVKHRYLACHHIANAVSDAAEAMSYEMQRLAAELYRVLMESDRKEKVREYILYQKSNRYMKLFLIQAYEASEKGDVVLSGELSLFSENVEHLRLEIMEELYRRKRQAHAFAGYTFVAMAPFFMMPVLKQWGLDFAPELEFFYAGTGVLLETLTAVAALVIYGLLAQAKDIVLFAEEPEAHSRTADRFYSIPAIHAVIQGLERSKGSWSARVRQMLLLSGEQTTYGRLCFKMLCLAAGSFLLLSIFCASVHTRERQSLLESVETIGELAPLAKEEKQKLLESYILDITRRNKDVAGITEEEIKGQLRERIRLGNENMERAVIQEIKSRIEMYREAKGTVWEFFLCLTGSLCIGCWPLFQLKFRVQAARAGAVQEVRVFQSVIIMERRLQGMTIVGLLEDMELFARCYRNILRKCINSYGAGAYAALVNMKEEGSDLHEGFEELADAFLSVDEVGIAKAFGEVESNRRLLEKMTRLEAEISMEKKKDSADLLAKFPMVLAVGVYFILPFFLYSLQGVAEVFELLEEMQR